MMGSRKVVPEDIFYDNVRTLINNLFINNPNYQTGSDYFWDHYKGAYELRNDVEKNAKYVLTQLESTKHLIDVDGYIQELEDKVLSLEQIIKERW